MAATGLLALLDDITTILDDVAALTKVAAKKTAGLAGDDLAVNAEGLVGLQPSRELPIVGKVALGSLANKFVLVPLALALPSAAITPLLMLGGTFLCYEGVHKVTHRNDEHDDAHHEKLIEALKTGPEALAAVESKKVRQAILTDVILSAEIVAVALGAVATEPLRTKALVLSVVALGMTAGIYGLVALIVKLDDIGLYMQRTGAPGGLKARFGSLVVDYTPVMMRLLSIGGTAAMFLVGGGIILHGFHGVEERIHHALAAITHHPTLEGALSTVVTLIVGVAVGAVATGLVEAFKAAVRVVKPGAFAGGH